MANWINKNIMITARTYPTPARSGIEVSCTAGITDDDKVAVRLNWEGTHLGQFMGIPPTGNKIDISTANTIKIVAGKWVELWNVSDSLRFMQQIGVIPSK